MNKKEHNILIDTSAWVDFFRGNSKNADILQQLIETEKACICGVIIYELMQGAKSTAEASRLSELLTSLPYFEMNPALWVKAGEISAELRAKGLSLPMSDIIIGVIALHNGLEVFTSDNHFASIPGIKLYEQRESPQV